MAATQKAIQSIIIESDSQFVINSIHDKTSMPKEIINLVEGIRSLSSSFKDISINIALDFVIGMRI